MAALECAFEALAVDPAPAEALTLLDALARAPAAAALVVAALQEEDRSNFFYSYSFIYCS